MHQAMSNFLRGQQLQVCNDRKKKQSESMELQIPLDCKEVNVPKNFIAVISYRSKRSKQILS